MARFYLFVSLALLQISKCLAVPVDRQGSMNKTIELPEGSRYIPNEHLLCVPSTWKSIIPFFLANYFAHIATVKTIPGESTLSTFFTLLFALAFPGSGLARGLTAISQRANFCKTPLQKACRAEALCVVVRTVDWRPRDGDIVKGVRLDTGKSNSKENALRTKEKFSESTRRFFETEENQVEENQGVIGMDDAQETDDNPYSSPRIISHPSTTEADGTALSNNSSNNNINGNSSSNNNINNSSSGSNNNNSSSNNNNSSSNNDNVVNAQSDEHRPPLIMIRSLHKFVSRIFLPATHLSDLIGRTVHGVCELPKGYAIAILPSDTPHWMLAEDTVNELDGPLTEKKSPDNRIFIFRAAAKIYRKLAAALRPTHSTTLYHSDDISMSYSLPKALIAVFQAIYASFTLYETRGDQINRYGYAAFGLTVTPYLVMSIVNLISNAVTPDFDAVYLMRDEVMTEVEHRTGKVFERVVGSVREPPQDTSIAVMFKSSQDEAATDGDLPDGEILLLRILGSASAAANEANRDQPVTLDDRFSPLKCLNIATKDDTVHKDPAGCILVPSSNTVHTEAAREDLESQIGAWAWFVSAIPIAVMGGLTHFRKGQSSYSQRVWIMTWLVLGSVIGPVVRSAGRDDESGNVRTDEALSRSFTVFMLFVTVPAIGGLLVVGQMLSTYGSCTQLF